MGKFILLVVVCYLTVKVNGNCWWTGCQPFSWAQRGCDVYNMDEQKQAECDEGTKFYCCPKAKKEKKKSSSGGSTARECWWTGCQPTAWAQRGCGVYNMDEIASEECEDGDKFHCCSKIKSSSSTSRSSSSSSKRSTTSSALQSEPKKRDCWWTGCQPTSWAKRGCSVYNMAEIATEECSDGDKYHCCEKIKSEESEEKTSAAAGQCWWTGCQPTSWAQRGCGVYDMDEVDNEECSDGNKFRCCPKTKKTTSKRSNSAQKSEKKVPEKCWWTGCMPNFLKMRGCEPFGLTEIERLVCNEGDQFHCCEKTEIGSTASQTEKKEEQCWWTGCQSFTWAQRGCDVYGMKEMDTEECEGGTKFNCCGQYKDPKKKSSSKNEIIRTTTTAKPKSGKSECWWTGCQPDSWAKRGCGVYNMDEKESEECDGGNKFHCCTKGSVSISSRSDDESTPKRKTTRANKQVTCKWTGCQPNSWSDKGCLDEDDVEIENEECDGGMKYHCCDGEPLTTPRPKRSQTTQKSSYGSRALSPTNPTKLKLNAHNLKQECWWTGCQPSSWPQRGCRIYSMIEMNNERCGEGVRYQCCKKQMPMKAERLTTGCWWTGCQPFDWAQRGCEVYEMNQIKVENCPHGEKYYCCGKATSPEELQRGLRLKSVP